MGTRQTPNECHTARAADIKQNKFGRVKQGEWFGCMSHILS